LSTSENAPLCEKTEKTTAPSLEQYTPPSNVPLLVLLRRGSRFQQVLLGSSGMGTMTTTTSREPSRFLQPHGLVRSPLRPLRRFRRLELPSPHRQSHAKLLHSCGPTHRRICATACALNTHAQRMPRPSDSALYDLRWLGGPGQSTHAVSGRQWRTLLLRPFKLWSTWPRFRPSTASPCHTWRRLPPATHPCPRAALHGYPMAVRLSHATRLSWIPPLGEGGG
jgi:hypothetical protein